MSNHPIAKAILEKYEDSIDTNTISEYKEIAGKGIRYRFELDDILVGNAEFVQYKAKEIEDTILYVSANSNVIGYILLKDEIKENVANVISFLKKSKITTKMFTGDNQEIAKRVANEIGIDEVYAEMLPTDKYNKLEEMLNHRQDKEAKICFVGDGINDSPVLAISDIGISMGGIGSNAAIEASDIVIMTDEISKITEGIKISKFTNFIIKQNLIFAIGTKLLFLSLSIFGLTGMWQAIFADVGVTLITILNSIRILKK